MFTNPLQTMMIITLVMVTGLVAYTFIKDNKECECEKAIEETTED